MGGTEFSGRESVGRAVAGYFKGITGQRRGGRWRWRWRGLGAPTIGAEEAERLIVPFTEDETRDAGWGLNAEWWSGLDGFPILFFKEFWSLLKE
jgi:hypothetical protein